MVRPEWPTVGWIKSTSELSSTPEITCLTANREGGVWFGTGEDGLHQLRERLIRVFTTRNGLSGKDVRSVCLTPRSWSQCPWPEVSGGTNAIPSWPPSVVAAGCDDPTLLAEAHSVGRWQINRLFEWDRRSKLLNGSVRGPVTPSWCRQRRRLIRAG